jgi:flagellar hook assembly protein FlgD
VEVKAKGSGAAAAACSFTVTVRQVTATNAMNAPTPSMDIYPNPFTHEVSITVVNPSLKEVTVEIYSISGQKIKTLARALKGATISLVWKGDDEQGKKVPGGIYLVKMDGKTKKVVREE